MSHVHEGPLATYNSLTDTHLAGYFANNRMRRHLRKAGLVSKRGEIVSESTYRLNMSRREHKKHVKDMLAQAIVHKSLDMERSRQAEIKKKLEEIAKMQLVRRVRDDRTKKYEEALLPLLSPRSNRTRTPSPRRLRSHRTSKSQSMSSVPGSKRDKSDRASTSRKGDEDILPILTPRSSSQSPRSSPRGRGRRSAKPVSNGVQGVLYLDDEGRPITPALGSGRNPEQSNIDTRHLHSLDTVALRKYALLMAQMEEGRGLNSPYMMPQVPMPPRPPSSSRSPRSARRVQSASPRRVITTDSRLARLHRPETAKSHVGDQQTLCRVAMRYHGWALQLARDRVDLTGQEVVIEQQHCGGNTLTVFKERLEPGSKFEFISYRHRGYPFSLSLYVDGQMDSRVSTCCEYRHSRGAKIGGKQGHFSLLRVSGAVPCYKCQVAKGVRVPGRASPKRMKRPAEVRREEVIVVSTKADRGDGDRHRRQEKSEPAEDDYEDDVVMIPVERKEHESGSEYDEADSKPIKNAQSDDYADDFEDSQASHSSKYSSPSYSSAESESETEPSTPKEEGKNKGKIPERRPEPVFQPQEDRGEEREEEEEEDRDGVAPSPRGRDYTDYQERDKSSARSPRVPLNGTGRAIDDYSSDDDGGERTEVTPVTSYEKTTVVSVEEVDANNTPIRSRRRSASSSSSSSSADEKTPKSPGQGDAAVINVDLLDREEKREQEAAKKRESREELRRKEENDLLQKQQAERAQRMEERKKAEEARRQEDLYRQQQRDEERRKREEQRRREAEEEKQRREEDEERRRHQAQIEDDPDARERQRMESQMLRDEQIRREQQERDEKRKQQEEERERAWKQEETKREHKLKMDAEEREKKRVEEGLSSARSETSTARSTTTSSAVTSSAAETSSAESTPRKVPAQTLTTQDAEVTRPVSPLPAAAVYEDRRRLREPQNDTTPARPTSPLPPAATYEDRRQQREREGQAPRVRPVSPRGRPVSPLPAAAVYEDSKAARRAEEEQERARSLAVDAPVPAVRLQTAEESEDQPHTGRSSTTEVSTTATSDDDSDDDDNYSQRSLESVHEGRQHTRTFPGGIQQQDSGTADSSSDSDTSSGDASARATNIGASTTTDTANDKEGKDLASGTHATSESDGENMHGGADPDNVAQQEEGGELHPLRTRELPAAKAHKGEIIDLLPEGTDSVDLSNVLLNKTQVYQLGSHLETSSTVKMVTLCNTGLDDNDLQRLSEALAASPSQPVMLNLSLNSVSQKGIKHVLHALKAKPSIKLLILQGNPIGDAGIKELTQGLQDLHRQARVNRKAGTMEMNSDTMSVDSSSSSIDPSALAQKYLLQELDLTDTQLTDSGAAHMAQLVASNVYVENVNLSHNPRITAGGGWKQMGQALARNRCIRTLTLDGNRIGDEGIEHLAGGLQNNRVLRSLTLEDAGIGPEGGKHLMNMLKRNTSLLELTLSPGNTIPDALAEDIGKYIALNRTPYNSFGL